MLQVKRAITFAALALFASGVCNAEEKVAEEVVNGIPITSLHDDFNGSTVFRTPDVKIDAPTLNQRQALNQLYYGRGFLAHVQIGSETSPVVVTGELATWNAHMANVPLLKHSLQGKADELEKLAQSTRPLLGQVCRSGQATIWYAPPNSGKTLIGLYLVLEAIREGRLAAGNVYYINADDNSAGLTLNAPRVNLVPTDPILPVFRGGELLPVNHAAG